MLRSMYSGVSGLSAHQTKMDVVGNNISNVNTVGYKGSRVTFQEMLNQTMQNAKSPQENKGGINPMQIGLGTKVGSIDVDHTQGNLQSTGIATDLAIEGNGYFVVNNGMRDLYTRAGSLSLDSNGNLINSANGFQMQGWAADDDGNINTNVDISGINIPMGQGMPAEDTTEIAFGGNLSSNIEDGVYRRSGIDVFDSLGNQHTVDVDFLRQAYNTMSGENDYVDGTETYTVKANQEIADPQMQGMTINFNQDSGEDKIDVGLGNNQVTVTTDYSSGDISVSDIEKEINSILSRNGYTGTIGMDLYHDPDTGDEMIIDDATELENIGSVEIKRPEFDSGRQVNLSVIENPDTEARGYSQQLDDMKIEFVEDTSLSGTVDTDYTYKPDDNVNMLTVYGNWNSDPPTEETVINAMNDELESEGVDGLIDWEGFGSDVDTVNLDGIETKMSVSSEWDWNVANVSDAIEDSIEGNGTLKFDNDGRVSDGNSGQISFNPLEGAAPTQEIDILFDRRNDAITQRGAKYSLDGVYADGYESGDLDSFSINESGVIRGNYSNGINRDLGQIAISNFNNPNGLKKIGDTMFARSRNSGIPQLGTAGTGGRGDISGGSLEMSNVDMAEQFTEMITTQRGFQANSKTITTSDEILQELVNLKR